MKDINLIEVEKLIGIEFENKGVLITALTHSSYANQFKDVKYNERLEFLGDSVLQLCVTKYLFNNYKDKSEGELTKIIVIFITLSLVVFLTVLHSSWYKFILCQLKYQ